MIPYKLPDEKEVLLQYSQQFKDHESRVIIERGVVNNQHEAIHLAEFFWRAFTESASRIENRSAMQATHEYVFLTLVDTLFAYFNLAGYHDVWDDVTERRAGDEVSQLHVSHETTEIFSRDDVMDLQSWTDGTERRA